MRPTRGCTLAGLGLLLLATGGGEARAVGPGWLGPGAELAPEEPVDIEVAGALHASIYGPAPQVGLKADWAPSEALSLGASSTWVGPSATVSTLGGRYQLLDSGGLGAGVVVRGALATRFDGGLAAALAGVGPALEWRAGRLRLGAALPVVGLRQTREASGLATLPGLWDVQAGLDLGPERRGRLEAGAQSALVFGHLGYRRATTWGHWRLTMVTDSLTSALVLGLGLGP